MNEKELKKKLGLTIRRLRRAKDITQEELAKKADVCQATINHVEKGRKSTSVYVLYKIENVLGPIWSVTRFIDRPGWDLDVNKWKT